MRTNLQSTILLTISFFITSLSFGQSQDQLTSIQAIGEGSVFKKFWGINTSNGVTTGSPSSMQGELKFEMNVLDKIAAFRLNEPGTDNTLSNGGFGFLEPNHLTKPSVFHSDRHDLAYVYIDGLMYALINVKDPQNISSFKIDEIYVLMKPAQGEHTSGKTAMKELKSRDHEAVISTYLVEMKATQETSTANFTEEEQNEDLIIKQAKIDHDNGIAAKNAEFYNSPEGKQYLKNLGMADITLVNDTEADLLLCYGSGAYSTLKPGEKQDFSCSGNGTVRLGKPRENNSSQHDDTGIVLLTTNGTNCGSVINVSTVLN